MDSVATASLFAMPVVRPAIPALPPIFNLQFAPTPSAGHQALPCVLAAVAARRNPPETMLIDSDVTHHSTRSQPSPAPPAHRARHLNARSEEHTSELQSLMRISYAVFCLKKKKKT